MFTANISKIVFIWESAIEWRSSTRMRPEQIFLDSHGTRREVGYSRSVPRRNPFKPDLTSWPARSRAASTGRSTSSRRFRRSRRAEGIQSWRRRRSRRRCHPKEKRSKTFEWHYYCKLRLLVNRNYTAAHTYSPRDGGVVDRVKGIFPFYNRSRQIQWKAD